MCGARPNLTILADTRVRRLMMDGSASPESRSRRRRACATISAREVILCAGSIHSPAMLLRAGIGPAERLQRLGIPVVADRPGVGRTCTIIR